jgi:DNA-binding NarL/FixJ family response regulator
MIKIAIVDDHPVVMTGVKAMLDAYEHISVIATYKDAGSLLADLPHNLPDVLLLDIQMPGQHGDELTIKLKKKYPSLPILVLTNFDHSIYINNMLNNGASGYLLKNVDSATLIKAIECVHKGAIFLLPEMQEQLEHYREKVKARTPSRRIITPREKDILELIVKGFSSKEIAAKLYLSLRTIENYRFNLSLKLEAKSTADLVQKAADLGLVIK